MDKIAFERYDVSKFDDDGLRKFVREFLNKNRDVRKLNLTSWSVSHITNMAELFAYTFNLERIDITGWDTSNVWMMNGLFNHCHKLKEVVGFNSLNLKKVKYMEAIFQGCVSLEVIDLSNPTLTSLLDIYAAFEGCSLLRYVDITSWCSKLINEKKAFDNCSKELVVIR